MKSHRQVSFGRGFPAVQRELGNGKVAE